MKLIIVHYHLRPGGIRRIIELAAGPVLDRFHDAGHTVVLAAGEDADPKWKRLFQTKLAGASLKFFIEPAFGYFSEQITRGGKQCPGARPSQSSAAFVSSIQKRIRLALDRLLKRATPENTLVWMHNPGVGRNLLLTRELTRACGARGLRLVMHHHDWWFDNRWRRWPEMRQAGFPTLKSVAKVVFPFAPTIRHLAINRPDAARLARHLPGQAGWLPNLSERGKLPGPARVREGRAWLRRTLGSDAPVWILPCRFLRRKNIAEALLLTRWLRPEAWLVTTGGVSSADEQTYFDRLDAAARNHRWAFRPALLQGGEANKPTVAELLAASEAVLLTSIQEGFGLPYLEAAAARRPLLARSIPNIAPDLEQFGFDFPQSYEEILIDPGLFDWRAESKRQARLFQNWRRQLPRAVQDFASPPAFLADTARPRTVPFSRLTLTAQLEILAQSPALSWKLCAALNAFLGDWRERAKQGCLRLSPWPRQADKQLSSRVYARRLAEYARPGAVPEAEPRRRRSADPTALQEEFLRATLGSRNLFPLLWAIDT